MKPPKLVLVYVDSLRSDMLERAIADGNAPHFGRLLERGTLVGDCVSSFPSVTPVACSEMVTGVAGDRHWISGMNWYHRLERRYVEYGSSLEASRAFGIFNSLYDVVYNMNLAHLNPGAQTIFERLDGAGVRTASTPFLIYRGRHRHPVSLEGLTRRAIDVSGLKLNHHTWGPRELFYGDLYSSRPFPCRSSSIPGSRDGYSACCAAELAAANLYDFLLLSLPDNDHHSHRYGPEASLESIAKADHCFGKLVDAAGGMDGFLADHAVILVSDHGHSEVREGLALADRLAERWPVLQPSDESPEGARLAVSPTSRAGHVYRLGDDPPGAGDLHRELAATEGVDLVCWLSDADGEPLRREQPGLGGTAGVTAQVEGASGRIAFHPAPPGQAGAVRDRRGRRWQVTGALEPLAATIDDGVIDSHSYPDPLGRVWSALTSPHAGDAVVSLSQGYELVDWGGASHAGGGSHGSLLREDSVGPLLMAGCGPESAGDRDQWALRDVASIVLGHFGVGHG